MAYLQERKAKTVDFERDLNSELTYYRRRHIRGGIHFLSNKCYEEEDFQILRESIYHAASKLPSWGEDTPVRWIHMEKALDNERLKTKSVLSLSYIVKLAKGLSVPINDPSEVKFFLKYQHLIGNLIFFEDTQDYIIIKPSWLIDAFRCLVCAIEFRKDLLNDPRLVVLTHTGEVQKDLIGKLFSKVPECFDHQDFVLEVMMKFDIIVRDYSVSKPIYIIPSIIEKASTKPWNQVCKQYGADQKGCTRTSWICFDFDFLPPAIYNSILVLLLRDETYERVELFHEKAIFDIKCSLGCQKLVICKTLNTICLQVWSWSKNRFSLRHIIKKISENILYLKSKYGVMIAYKLTFMCGIAHFTSDNSKFDEEDLNKSTEGIYCNHHKAMHSFSYALSLKKHWIEDQVKYCL